jgi:RNA recognition motif-containing protein
VSFIESRVYAQKNDDFLSLSLLFRGFAFVVFSSPDAVEKVMENLPHTIDGRQVDAKRAIPHAIHQVHVYMLNQYQSLSLQGGIFPTPFGSA